MKKNLQTGFTLIELLVVIAIIGILATIVLESLSSATTRAQDSKIGAQLSSMRAQAQLYSPTATATGQAATYVASVGNGTHAVTAAAGNLFNDTSTTVNSLDALISSLPANTPVYFYAAAGLPSSGSAWYFAAGTSTGAYCVDYSGNSKSWTGTKPSSSANFISAFPTLATTFTCM